VPYAVASWPGLLRGCDSRWEANASSLVQFCILELQELENGGRDEVPQELKGGDAWLELMGF